jgi:hypothetical protein
MTCTRTYTTDEVDVDSVGTIHAPIEIDYSFSLDVESDGSGEHSRTFIAINNFSIDKIRIHKLALTEWKFDDLVGQKERLRITNVILDEIRGMEIEL